MNHEDSGSLCSQSRTSSSNSIDFSKDGAHTRRDRPEDWKNGCYTHYKTGNCQAGDCSYRHDLSRHEATKFLGWVKDGEHQVFESSSTPESGSRVEVGGFSGASGAEEEDVEVLSKTAEDEHKAALTALLGNLDGETLRAMLPLDPRGSITSIGSLLHARAKCIPCATLQSGAPCPMGIQCTHCHLPHKTSKRKVKPCKAKRESYRRLVATISANIDEDPSSFNDETVKDLPNFVRKNDTLTKKLVRRLEAHKSKVMAGSSPSGDASSSFAPGSASSSTAKASAPASSSDGKTAPRIVVSL